MSQIRRKNLFTIFSVAFTLIWTGGHAASFDCERASTYVEKRICADAKPLTHGLSKLDDDMDRAYQTILQRTANPAEVRTAQRQWLKTRDACTDAKCIQRAYEKRFVTLHAPRERPATVVPSNPKITVESHIFPSEAEKLKAIQEVLRNHKLYPSSSFYGIKDQPYCAPFMQDLIAGEVKAVEPDVRAETAYDPALKKWHSCDGKELKDAKVNHPREFYDGVGLLGQPLYRYYRLELDGNPQNGDEDLLYHETAAPYYDPKARVGRTGYSWVDLDACVRKGGASASNVFAHRKNPGDYYRFSLIAKYKEIFLALSIHPNTKNPKISNYNVHMIELKQRSMPRLVCSWSEPIIETSTTK